MIGLSSTMRPVLIYGPFVSSKMDVCLWGLVLSAVCTPIICPRCSAQSPCEKLSLATFSPSSMSTPALSGCSVLGLIEKIVTQWCRWFWFFWWFLGTNPEEVQQKENA